MFFPMYISPLTYLISRLRRCFAFAFAASNRRLSGVYMAPLLHLCGIGLCIGRRRRDSGKHIYSLTASVIYSGRSPASGIRTFTITVKFSNPVTCTAVFGSTYTSPSDRAS